jgi:hypothetical protein
MELIVEVALGIILAVVLLALGAVVLAWIVRRWDSICGAASILAVRGGSRLFRMAESIAKIAAIPLGSAS